MTDPAAYHQLCRPRGCLLPILMLVALLCLGGCILTESRVDPVTGETVASPLAQAASGAIQGGISGGPAGGVLGGLGGLVAGLGAAWAARRGRTQQLGQIVRGIGSHLQAAPVQAYAGLDAAAIVQAERERLLAALSSATDVATKAVVRDLRGQAGIEAPR